MADGIFGSGNIVRPYLSPFGSPRLETIPQGSTISTALFSVGDMIQRGATTNAHRAVQHSTGVTANLTGGLGFAAEAAKSSITVGGANTSVLYYPVDGVTQFIGVVKGVLASSVLDTLRAIRKDSTLNIMYIDTAIVSTATMAIVDDFVDGSAIGDTNGLCVFRVASSCCQKFHHVHA